MDSRNLDNTSPIQICAENEENLSPIMLLEETEYELNLVHNGDKSRDLEYLKSSGDAVSLKQSYFGSDNGSIYSLYFKSYVGKGFFDIHDDGETIRIPFDVRSKKLGYLNDYPRMLEDISEFSTSLLLDVKSPLYRNYSYSEDSRFTKYEDFILLDYIFSKRGFEKAYEEVRKNIHGELVTVNDPVPIQYASSIDPTSLMDLIASGNLIPCADGPIAAKYYPKEIIENRYENNIDTTENRMVKDPLVTMYHMVRSLDGDIGLGDYVVKKLTFMRQSLESMLSDGWLNEVGNIESSIFVSQILIGRQGYRELYEIYQLLGISAEFSREDIPDLLEGHNTKVHRVYEYWCYVQLFGALRCLSDNPHSYPLTVSENGKWSLTIKNGKSVPFKIRMKEGHLLVHLYYNKEFGPKSDDFKSYSLRLRPDYTLVITTKSEKRFIVNFDAKYKAKPVSSEKVTEVENIDCWEFDIYKMHTYRDALLYSFGSYVLYPGTVEQIYVKPRQNQPDAEGLILPSVGSIPLVPGNNKYDELEKSLGDIFQSILKIDNERSSHH